MKIVVSSSLVTGATETTRPDWRGWHMRSLPYEGQQIRRAQFAFMDGRELPAGLVSHNVQRSWERLRQTGATPKDRARFERSRIPSHLLDDRGNRNLLSAATPEMEALHGSLRSKSWSVLCINPAGAIIGALCDNLGAPAEIVGPLRAGHSVMEHDIGTNAPAIALLDREPVVVQRAEHFLVDLDTYVCAASPIYGVDGEIAGAIDVTGSSVHLHDAILEHVILAAHAIENRMFSHIRDVRLIALHYMPEFLGTPSEGILAVTDDGAITAANRAACRMLGTSRQELVRRSLEEVFEGPAHAISHGPEAPRAVLGRAGRRYFIRTALQTPVTELPARPRAAMRAPPAPQAIDVGDPAVAKAIESGRKAISRGLSLLIRGETGSGKEVLARSLHSKGKPFVALNCSAIPESLMEAELFGYADGAFTGAKKGGSIGAIEQADGGTLFLDEIGDATLALQAKLLRVLQEGTFCRLGSRREVQVDVNVVAATHRDLKQMIAEGSFREDLYYRLNGISVRLPPLRERQDIEQLIDDILGGLHHDGTASTLAPDARAALLAYDWPGNVRQLSQALAAAVGLCDDPERITLEDFPADLQEELLEPRSLAVADHAGSLLENQADCILKMLNETNNNVSETARRLKISRTTVYSHLSRIRAH
ncbi:sigma-54-dependent Fis family transcriptional regulator [Sphingopyxis sp. USTB-05]|uniref:sigma-54-dependent Fis family transcriptional regulator n=1 Tax=Sphingopyxis sp. USTB-05 TaxID=2830667 RepID=UPI002078B512|nr:sigma-54-dependent Fis family transcriptional regulator [Sphingopyxis sp. USTB-05]USI77619.1 sigma-54-dependent Fis family transcriptional regulator [Sphingopyxis sp. USTB-05]